MPELPKTSWGRTVAGEKSTAIAVILNILIPGLGTIYAGKNTDGIITLASSLFITCIGTYASCTIMITPYIEMVMFCLIMICIWLIGYITLLIYSIIVSTKACTETNILWETYLKNN